jgi:hypothetical protein
MRFSAFLFLLLLPIAAANAQGDIHRCLGTDGRPVFTDRVCSDVNATAVLPPVPASTAPVSVAAPVQSLPAPPPPVLCAADEEHLKQALVDAFAVRNPNRLAGLMLWNGAGQQAVVANIRVLTRLMAHALVDVEIESGDAGYSDDDSLEATSSSAAAHGGSLVVQTEADDGSGETATTRFDILHHAGCLWLHPQG